MKSSRAIWHALGLALAQQAIGFGAAALLAPPPAPGAERNWGVTAIYLIGSALLGATFYGAAWLGMAGAPRLRGRFGRSWLIGIGVAAVVFTAAAALNPSSDPKSQAPGYAQMIVLTITLLSALRIDDAREALSPTEPR